ncbi:MAG: hypothetical protein JSR09_01205 [Bacteroidetes bacterium]|nr:hypothetical protein [Bacteroidota bacterium]
MNLKNFILASKDSIIQKIVTDTSISDDKKRLYLKYLLVTDDTSKKTEELKDKEFILLPLNEPCLRDYHLKGKVNLTDFVNELQRKFRIKSQDKYMGLYNLQSVAIGNLEIHVQDLEEFIREYRAFPTMTEYTIPRIAMSYEIDWNNEFILKYADLLSFHYLHRNPKVAWNFELIEKLKDSLNWSYISSYEYLHWTPELLDRYKDYLIFSVDKSGWEKSGKNRNGSSYSILHVSEYPQNPFSYLVGCISSSKSIQWTEEIIDSVIEYWDWEELCANRSLHWTATMIDKYKSYVNFNSLSTNPNVDWGSDILHRYEDLWNWEELSANSGLPWDIKLIEEFIDRWTWKPSFNHYWDECWKGYPCLSINEGIFWTPLIINKWKEKIDFWLIARNGNISPDVLYEHRDKFRRKELTGWIHHRYSDWRETEDINKTGWECLLNNNNFKVTEDILSLLQEEEIEMRFSVGYDFARTGEYEYQKLSLLELYKDCTLDGISLTDIYDNYDSWGKTFFNPTFINGSLYQKEIKPYFEKKLFLL